MKYAPISLTKLLMAIAFTAAAAGPAGYLVGQSASEAPQAVSCEIEQFHHVPVKRSPSKEF